MFPYQKILQAMCPHVLSQIEPPSPTTPIYKDDCMFCFDTSESTSGLDICLTCFQSFCRGELNHTIKHSEESGHIIYLNTKKTPKPKDPQQKPPKIAKLEIKEFSEEELFNFENTLYCAACDFTIKQYPENISRTISHILNSNSSAKQNEIKSWEQEIFQCEHSISIEQTGDKPDLSKCNSCELTENLWICLHCGELGCGREQFGGIKGNSHALNHFQTANHPIAVKLGSLSPTSADCYCYQCNDEVKVGNLDAKLSKYGINLNSHEKTEKNLIELQLDQNMNWEFNLDGRDGTKLHPVFGKNLTGFKNLGNSCYLNSVLQNLFQLSAYQEKFSKLSFPDVVNPSEDLTSQLLKIYDGLSSGRYSHPSGEDGYQKGIKPSSFKNLIGENHVEFSTMKQQDAFEFWSYLVDKIDSLFPSYQENPNLVLKFLIENKLKCQNCGGVKLSEELVDNLSVPIKDTVINVDEQGHKEYETIKLSDSLSEFASDELIDLNCDSCEGGNFQKSTKLKTFPDVLVINTLRIKLENWVPIKIDVPIATENELDLSNLKSNGLLHGESLLENTEAETDEFKPNQSGLNQLLEMGFPEPRCVKALYHTGNSSGEEAMNWLFAHMEEPDIDEPLKVESKGTVEPSVNESDVANLINMGFSEKLSTKALILNNNDPNLAIDWLFNNPNDNGELPAKADTGATSSTSELKEYLMTQPEIPQYKLKGIVCHKGTSPHTGHYVTYIRCPIDGQSQWVLFNDEKVVVCDEFSMKEVEKNGYIYVYVKVGSVEDIV